MDETTNDRDAALAARYARRAEAAQFQGAILDAIDKAKGHRIIEPSTQPLLTGLGKSE